MKKSFYSFPEAEMISIAYTDDFITASLEDEEVDIPVTDEGDF